MSSDNLENITPVISADIHYVDMLRGKDGESAFQLAVDQGYTGTLDEWLASLKGADGKDGADGAQGIQGEKGETGASGKDGVSPTLTTSKADGVTTITITDASGTKTASIADGAKGDKGDTGATGEKGADGYTPVKGTDYFTDADKAEIVNAVLAQVVDGTEVEY